MLLYFIQSKNSKNFAVLFILLYFLRFQEGGYCPLSHPPKSTTDDCVSVSRLIVFDKNPCVWPI